MTKTRLKHKSKRLIKYLIVLAFAFYAFIRIESHKTVIDGDTIVIGREKIRFSNIDAPEMRQTCICQGKETNCGIKAKDALFRFIGSNTVSCEPKGRDFYGRLIAECFININGQKTSLNTLMVQDGMAVVISKHDERLLSKEAEAISRKKGFWGCERFELPSNFRKKARTTTAATAVPAEQEQLP